MYYATITSTRNSLGICCFLVYTAALEMHPLDTEDRSARTQTIAWASASKYQAKCCTKVCPEHITITDNAIIPLKERTSWMNST